MHENFEKLINNPDLKKYTIKQFMKDFNTGYTRARNCSRFLKKKDLIGKEKIEKIKKLSAIGLTNKEITDETGFDLSIIRAVRFLYGFESACSNKAVRLTREIAKQIIEDDKKKLSIDEQVVKHGFSKTVLYKFRKTLGLIRGDKNFSADKISNSLLFLKLQQIDREYPGTGFKFMRAVVNNILIKNPEASHGLNRKIVEELKLENESQAWKLMNYFFLEKKSKITHICKSSIQVYIGRRDNSSMEYSDVEKKYGFIQKWDCKFRSECLDCTKIYQDRLFFDCGVCDHYQSINPESDWKENRKHA
jgi:hypothetical protein